MAQREKFIEYQSVGRWHRVRIQVQCVAVGRQDRFKRRTSVFFGSGTSYLQAAASIDYATFWQVIFGSNDVIFLKIIARASHHGQ
jgi:hypothetical protein